VPVEHVNYYPAIIFAAFALCCIPQRLYLPRYPLYVCTSHRKRIDEICSPSRIAKSVVELTLKTLGTVTVSLVDSPLAEMTVTVGLDMVSRVGVAVVSIADLSWS
jgi:hypothetical protein